MTTFQEMTGADVSTYDTLDGVSFYKQLYQQPHTPRPWIYDYTTRLRTVAIPAECGYRIQPYKLYGLTDKFYNIAADPYEQKKLKGAMTRKKNRSTRISKYWHNTGIPTP